MSELNKRVVVLRGECDGDCGGNYSVAAGEELSFYQMCGGGDHSLTLRLAEGAKAKVVFAATEQGESNYDYTVELNGAGAELELYGLYLCGEGAKCHIRTNVRHNVADCKSNQVVKGIAKDNGVGTFDGLVYVAPDAQRTEAYQQSRNMLLSRTARIHTNPQLEIYADDVKCSHGATVGNIDDEAIYYMRQRGLSEEQARRLQVGGFLRDVLSHIDDEAIREEFELKIENLRLMVDKIEEYVQSIRYTRRISDTWREGLWQAIGLPR